ncbi:MAG TPA: diguanylate cyclase [Candidatus Avalokitesvara rifleensis]|uniref:diguanylate cyclase n=1 Tax=Candidatus Avalokitesvara rifleensis TaxID=3367620 RepID=UPI0027126088|nr:diguanylate cyclase [Candidatus Brocadiales bacterium]
MPVDSHKFHTAVYPPPKSTSNGHTDTYRSKHKMKPLYSLKGRLLLFGLCISLIPIVITTTIYYLNARGKLKKEALNELAVILELKKAYLFSYLQKIQTRAVDFSSDGFIRDSLEKINQGGVGKEEIAALNRHLEVNKRSLDPYLGAIAVVDRSGRVVASTSEAWRGEDISKQEVFSQGIGLSPGKTYVRTLIFCPYIKKYCTDISTPLTSVTGGEKIGLIINCFDMAGLNEITIHPVGLDSAGEVYIVDKDKTMITESRFVKDAAFSQKVDTAPIHRTLEGGKGTIGIYPNYLGKSVVGTSLYLPEYDWVLVAEMDKAEAFSPLRNLGIVTLITWLVTAASVTAVGIVFAQATSSPINKLRGAARGIAGGDLGCRVETNRRDEIGDLSRDFNNMAGRLQELTGSLEQRTAERTEALQKTNKELREKITECNQVQVTLNEALKDREKGLEKSRDLMEFSNLMREEIQEEMVIKHMVHFLKNRFHPDTLAVLMRDNGKDVLNVVIIEPLVPADRFIKSDVLMEPSFCRVLRTGHKYAARDINKDPCCECLLYKPESGEHVCFPMIIGGATDGVIVMVKKEKGYWDDEEHINLISTYIDLAASSLHRVRLTEQSRLAAISDPLTGIYNRRFFNEMLMKQMALAKRHNEPFCILISDLDHFKRFNDTYGHLTGDYLLQQIAGILKNLLRTSDTLARYGGEEFIVIMPGTDMASALKKAEDIRQSVETASFDNIIPRQSLKMTISIGVSSFPEHGADYDTLVGAADKALYKAKEGGRNRVEKA